jgi:hypothetical protein
MLEFECGLPRALKLIILRSLEFFERRVHNNKFTDKFALGVQAEYFVIQKVEFI